MAKLRTQMHFLPTDRSVTRAFRTGVSLHSHTEHSRERLETMPRYLERMPVVSRFYQREMKRYWRETGEMPDFSKAYWRGPLSARAAYDLERKQIECLGLGAIASLTDHDTIDAALLLNSEGAFESVPISVEWTVPYVEAYFHVGIHNLPPARAVRLMQEMAEYTAQPRPEVLARLLEQLDADPDVLVVLNHPLWDMAGVGLKRVLTLIRQFLRSYGPQVHALEANGLRHWQENIGVVHLAQKSGHPVVAGGDRHGLEPNAVINLSRASCMAEFVEEIRKERSSDIAILPQYREPLVLRHMLTAWDAVREHPTLVDRQRWMNRVYVQCDDGVERPLSSLWTEGAPAWIDPCLNVIGMLASQALRTPFRLAYPATGSAVS